MALSDTERVLMLQANAMGYFPSAAQAKEINLLSAAEHAAHFGNKPPAGRVNEEVSRASAIRAIKRVMEENDGPQTVIEGVADGALIDRVSDVLRDAAGQAVRVRIEEV